MREGREGLLLALACSGEMERVATVGYNLFHARGG